MSYDLLRLFVTELNILFCVLSAEIACLSWESNGPPVNDSTCLTQSPLDNKISKPVLVYVHVGM